MGTPMTTTPTTTTLADALQRAAAFARDPSNLAGAAVVVAAAADALAGGMTDAEVLAIVTAAP